MYSYGDFKNFICRPLNETIVKAFSLTTELDSRCFSYNTAYELDDRPLEKSEQESLEIILRIPGYEPIPEPFVPGVKVMCCSYLFIPGIKEIIVFIYLYQELNKSISCYQFIPGIKLIYYSCLFIPGIKVMYCSCL